MKSNLAKDAYNTNFTMSNFLRKSDQLYTKNDDH